MANLTKTYDSEGNQVMVETTTDAVKDSDTSKTLKTILSEISASQDGTSVKKPITDAEFDALKEAGKLQANTFYFTY